MIKLFKSILFILFLSTSAFAETIQLHQMGTLDGATIAASGNNFTVFGSGGSFSTAEANRQSLAPTAGTVIRMKAYLATDPANGAGVQSVTIAIRINGATSSTSCTITEGSTSCQSDVTSTYTAGQTLAIIQTAANTPTLSRLDVWVWTVDNTNNQTMHLASTAGTNMSNAAANYYPFVPGNVGNATENLAQVPMPFAGNITALYIKLGTFPGVGKQYVFTIYKNGSAVGGNTCTISGGSATTCNDTVTSLAFNAGDTITLESNPGTTPTATTLRAGILVTNTVGGFMLAGGQSSATSFDGINNKYHAFSSQGWQATEAAGDVFASQVQIRNLYFEVNTAPDNGAGTQTYTGTIKNLSGTTGCSCVISEAAVNCNSTCTSDQAAEDKLTFESVPASTPVGSGCYFSSWAFINPRDFFTVN